MRSCVDSGEALLPPVALLAAVFEYVVADDLLGEDGVVAVHALLEPPVLAAADIVADELAPVFLAAALLLVLAPLFCESPIFAA